MEGDIEERLARLENRLKTNFFEVEKRLIKLETASGAALNERIQELEDLLLLLQLENIRIKEGASSADISEPDIEARLKKLEERKATESSNSEERLSNIENRISSIKTGDLYARLDDIEKRVASIKSYNVKDRSNEIEKMVSSSKIKGPDTDEIMNKLEARISPINDRLKAIEDRGLPLKAGENKPLERKIKAIEDKLFDKEGTYTEISESVKGIADYVKENIEERLEKLENTASQKSLPDTETISGETKDSILEEVDKKLLDMSNKFNRRAGLDTEPAMKSIEGRMDELENNISIAVEESENISKDFERRLSSLENRPRSRGVDSENIDKKFSEMKKQLTASNRHFKKIDFLSKEIAEIDKRLNSMELKEKSDKGSVLHEVGKILGGEDEQ